MSTNKRAADARRARDADADALLDRRCFSLDPERWAAFQAALDAPARPNPRLKKLLQTPSVFECATPVSDRRRLKVYHNLVFGLIHSPVNR